MSHSDTMPSETEVQTAFVLGCRLGNTGDRMGGITVGVDAAGGAPRGMDDCRRQVGKLRDVPSDKGAVGVGLVCGGGNVGVGVL